MEKEYIAEVMEEEDVTVADIPRETPFSLDQLSWIESSSRRYFSCRAFALFNRHDKCSRNWGSARAWCIIDLKEQRIIHKFNQDCQSCEESVSPEYDDEAVRRMAEYAVKTFLLRSGRARRIPRDPYNFDDVADALVATKGPHDEDRCEKCRLLGHSCQ